MGFLPYIWALIGLLFIGAEFFLPAFVILFFGIGALITALLTAIIPGLKPNITLQIILWLASSGLTLAFLRRRFSSLFKGNLAPVGESDNAGKTATVVEAISPEQPGRIRFQGTTWKAISYDESFAPGETVEILKEENLTFVVTRSILGKFPENPAAE